MIAACMLLAGCSTTARLDTPEVPSSAGASAQDLRPAPEKTSKIFSLLVTSEDYGIRRIGDDWYEPSPVRLLQARANQRRKASSQDAKIVVHTLVTYSNHAAFGKAVAHAAVVGGTLGGVMVGGTEPVKPKISTTLLERVAFEALNSKEYQRGQFTTAENPSAVPVFIVYIDAEIDGQRRFTRTVMPSPTGSAFAKELPLVMETAIAAHLDKY
ncbi:hypothetical protein ASC95_09060 [Pelomonas sp. Root1217]|nr:hypothetical protein ASC95_09060 [Pelomonas sp. Root1217]